MSEVYFAGVFRPSGWRLCSAERRPCRLGPSVLHWNCLCSSQWGCEGGSGQGSGLPSVCPCLRLSKSRLRSFPPPDGISFSPSSPPSPSLETQPQGSEDRVRAQVDGFLPGSAFLQPRPGSGCPDFSAYSLTAQPAALSTSLPFSFCLGFWQCLVVPDGFIIHH